MHCPIDSALGNAFRESERNTSFETFCYQRFGIVSYYSDTNGWTYHFNNVEVVSVLLLRHS